MPSNRPMPIAPMPVTDLPDDLRQYAVGDLGEAWFGFLAKAGPLTELFTPYYAALTSSTNVLGFKLSEMVRLAIATTTGCEACLSLRDPRALDEGMDPDVITLYDELDRADFTPRERAALRYTLAFSTNHHDIGDDMWRDLKEHFTDQELVTLCLFVATFLGTSRLAHTIRLVDAHCTIPGYRLAAVIDAKVSESV